MADSQRILIVGGAGKTGQRLCETLQAAGHQVSITTRQDPATVMASLPAGVNAYQADPVADAASFAHVIDHLGELDAVVSLMGAFLKNPHGVVFDGTRNVIAPLRQRTKPIRYVFCSTIAVYGDRPNEVLTEESPLQLNQLVGQYHAEMEQELLAIGEPIHPIILRLPHIYGPGRERVFDLMRQGNFVIFGDGLNPMHHFYINDVVQVIVAAIDPTKPDGIYNAVEDIACPYRDYCDFVTDWCGVPRLANCTLEEALAGKLAEFLGPWMRNESIVRELWANMTARTVISNTKMKQQLGVYPQYPSLETGLTEMLQLENIPDRRLGVD